jgi:hypothetical protein
MSSRRSHPLVLLPALLVLVVLLGTGCDQDVALDPSADSSLEGVQFLRIPSTDALGKGHHGKPEPSEVTVLARANEKTKITLGRFELKIPKGALSQDTLITLRRVEGPYLMCELEPHGIQFAKPVKLKMDLQGLDTADYEDWTIFWYDEDSGLWVDMGAVYDPDDEKVEAQLPHFSLYGGGRAGW